MDIKNKVVYGSLNDRQKEAVFHTEGPLLILAGAGSGKTSVLMHRIAYLIQEMKVAPYNIMAITFTNKAAAEMRERVAKLVGSASEQIWVATFHSSCVRILRRFINRIGFDNAFSIYDADDQKTLVKKIFKQMSVNSEIFKEKSVLKAISSYKDELITPENAQKYSADFYESKIAQIYEEYQKELQKNNALDFDDLINKCVELFEKDKEVLEYYQKRFKYIMVDEYQDTNNSQFRLIELLAGAYKNLCVVGDDDQSIYKFRGANIENILNFEKLFENTRVIKLEQNYRSFGNILEAANHVIANNKKRKNKKLWTLSEGGEKIRLRGFEDGKAEAEAVIKDIRKQAAGGNFNDFAILYRTNAQSRLFEERCVVYGIPYRLVGGVNFYQRKEIKDILAYLKLISNSKDDVAALRVINIPKRGLGEASLAKIGAFAAEFNISFYDACVNSGQIPAMGKAVHYKIKSFTDFIEKAMHDTAEGSALEAGLEAKVSDIINYILNEGGYEEYLNLEGEIEAQSRLENIKELINKADEYKASELDIFLEEVALIADIDRADESREMVTLMTLHAAKGLEFEQVYMCGMEESLFPGTMSIVSTDESELEEERRLCYVGITRAKRKLMLSYAKRRMRNGSFIYPEVSRFIQEIPQSLFDKPPFLSLAADKFGKPGVGNAAMKNFCNIGYKKTGFKNSSKNYLSSNFNIKNTFEASKRDRISSDSGNKFGKEFVVEKSRKPDYKVGDKVKHIKFGIGEILNITEGKRDYEIEVDFEKSGIKKMMAGFAKLEKI